MAGTPPTTVAMETEEGVDPEEEEEEEEKEKEEEVHEINKKTLLFHPACIVVANKNKSPAKLWPRWLAVVLSYTRPLCSLQEGPSSAFLPTIKKPGNRCQAF